MKSMLRALRSRIGKSVQDAEASQGGRVFYLVAEPGYPNYGDELIAGEWLKLLGSGILTCRLSWIAPVRVLPL